MAKHFGRLLQKGSGKFGADNDKSNHTGVLVNISAKVGSITDNGKKYSETSNIRTSILFELPPNSK